jgi:4-hydroxy-tetrahydrodipicolinate reductase
MIAMDENAAFLGECALISWDSPINNTGILFYNTLFDENACCHLALGRGFDNCVRDYEKYSADELHAMGVNDSMIHVDFMIGSSDLDITGITGDGKEVAIFRSANMSIGVAVLADFARRAAELMPGADIEIVEKHHNQKLDAPSGTALMIADGIKSVKPRSEYVYDRTQRRQKRDEKEIGIHSVRGGSIVGEHEVIFAGRNENVTLRHSALSREVFADGALEAASFMKGKTAGMYDMSCVLKELL